MLDDAIISIIEFAVWLITCAFVALGSALIITLGIGSAIGLAVSGSWRRPGQPPRGQRG